VHARFSILQISILTKALTLKIAAASLLLSATAASAEFELSGNIGLEQRYFFDQSQYSEQLNKSQISVSVEPELYWSWNGGNDSLIFKPFYRTDTQDDDRSHGDIRELSYIHVNDDWEFRAGIHKVFWGVTEFQHLADVINQTDGIENLDGEDKLGQQMLNLSLVKDWGIVDLYLLPGFRERTFPGSKSRLRGELLVDEDNVTYESSAKDKHVDLAVRWSHSLGSFDIGSYWFHGTNRDPILTPTKVDDNVELRQYYNQMDQFGLDVQATLGDWLWKFESIYRSTSTEKFWATQAGFEYTFTGAFDSVADIGLLMEYSWDQRGEGDNSNNDIHNKENNATTASAQNDIFLGSRIALNDAQSSELLMGFGTDLDHSASTFLIEATRRFGDNIKASLDLRILQSSEINDQLYSLRKDDYMQLSLEWFF
jgi:hypothetical protein